jgi:Putative peptidoglycan binding domain
MAALRKGDEGADVLKLQQALNKAGFNLRPDSQYGTSTENAVRAFQRSKGMLPDGIVGPKTMSALGYGAGAAPSITENLSNMIAKFGRQVAQPAEIAQKQPAVVGETENINSLHLSPNGKRFIVRHECLDGVSNFLHWPKGESGVTIGPGYDMKERSETQIAAHMVQIGVDPTTAQAISKASKLKYSKAEQFADDNKGLVRLSSAQELQLLDVIAPHYETIVKRNIHVDLTQYQYDALVCFTYNPGATIVPVTKLIDKGEFAKAMEIVKSRAPESGVNAKGLKSRRADEVNLFLYGKY